MGPVAVFLGAHLPGPAFGVDHAVWVVSNGWVSREGYVRNAGTAKPLVSGEAEPSRQYKWRWWWRGWCVVSGLLVVTPVHAQQPAPEVDPAQDDAAAPSVPPPPRPSPPGYALPGSSPPGYPPPGYPRPGYRPPGYPPHGYGQRPYYPGYAYPPPPPPPRMVRRSVPLMAGGIVLISVGVLGVIGGLALLQDAEDQDCVMFPCDTIDEEQQVAGGVAAGVGLAAIGGGIPMTLVGGTRVPEDKAPPSLPVVAPHLALGRVGVRLRWRW